MEKLFSKIFLIPVLVRYTVFSIKTGQRSVAVNDATWKIFAQSQQANINKNMAFSSRLGYNSAVS